MNHIIPFNNFLNEEAAPLPGIDLQAEFDSLNNLIWDGKIKSVPLRWEKIKSIVARVVAKGDQPVYLGASDFFDKAEPDFRNCLAHEMLHLYMLQNGLGKGEGYHGKTFVQLAKEINKRRLGIKIDVTDDVSKDHPTDMTPLEKPLGILLYKKKGDQRYTMCVMDTTGMNNTAIKKRVENTARVKRTQYDGYILHSKDPDLKKYPVAKTFDHCEYFVVPGARAMQLIDSGEQVDKFQTA